MKRILSVLLLSIFILLNTSAVQAEIPDITNCSIEELHQLQVEIIKELEQRKELPSFNAPIGVYEAGKDFPVGKYLITTPNYCTYITVYENMKMYNEGKVLQREVTIYEDESKIVDFTEGMVVFVDFSNARFEPYTGLVFE